MIKGLRTMDDAYWVMVYAAHCLLPAVCCLLPAAC
jgi:hypothetical protein